MSHGFRGPVVVVDTGVFGARLSRDKSLDSAYQSVLEGRLSAISFVTVAELRYGARKATWGANRLRQLRHEVTQAKVVWPHPGLVDAYVTLRTWCVRTGHGLGQKEHEADRWVAATAIWLGVPLVAHDAIFTNVRRLKLLTTL